MKKYEIKYRGEVKWQKVSEKAVLEDLADCFDRLTPVVINLLQGKEIATPRGIYRIKKKYVLN